MRVPGGAMLEVLIRNKTVHSDDGEVRAILRDVAFGVEKGEVVALLGPSGIGKSTILRIVTGLERGFEGSVRLPSGRVGMMFQEPRLLPWLRVDENLGLVQPEGSPPPNVAELLEEVLLPPGARGLLPSALSLGMARRVALARALAVEPEFLVLDEPFASLDPGVASALGGRIAKLVQRRGISVLFSTHDADQALAIASRILVLSGAPASLAADIAVPGDAETRRRARDDLLGRFKFLSAAVHSF